MDRTFHTKVIKRAYPQFSEIPFEDKSLKGQDPRAYRNQFVLKLLAYLCKEMRTARKYARIQYMVPRLIQYLARGKNWWVCPTKILYLVQLEKIRKLKKDQLIQYNAKLLNG